ncbi:MAG TPA: hypothetical protein VF538_10405 [Pyrinomonadaceae bacterium]|jgi:hypothetical protein
MLAALLVFATLASAVPPDAVVASVCCEGMGGAMKDSCPIMRLKALLQKQLAQSGSSCHARMETPPAGEAAHDEHGALPELFPAAEGDAAAAGRAADQAGSAADENASSPRATAEGAASHVSASKPCRSECCCQSNSLARNQRPRGEAAILNKFRPPASEARQRVAHAVLKDDSAARRLSPARAPPASL